MPEDNETIGSVSQSRYEQIVAELREVVDQHSRGQFTIGDRALEIEPSRPASGSRPEAGWTVKESLTRLAEDIALKYSTVNNARWVASRWPKERRQPGVSFTVYRILASLEDEGQRFAAVKRPPEGKSRWTADDASRMLGWQVESPVTKQEKISAIPSLAQDEDVAATVTTDLLGRPAVSAKVAVEDRVRVVEELTRDEQVAATAVTGLLRRPDVAFKAMSDDYPDYDQWRGQEVLLPAA
ncbi:DUF6192 family protein [Streptomyces avermitilis]|uniref:DUF6192 family protein n=1 Tax=Streptomyces avermitilis TaxID=33903 RepID=UPI0038086459